MTRLPTPDVRPITRVRAVLRLVIPVLTMLAAPEPAAAQSAVWMDAHQITGRRGPAMAYDVVRRKTVLFGGAEGARAYQTPDSTWEWDGVQWTERSPRTSPQGLTSMTMAYDAGRQRIVMVGMQRSAATLETWEWDGDDWTARTPPASPSPRFEPGLAYDVARRRVVLFGGRFPNSALSSETWLWDGTRWTRQQTSRSPVGRVAPLAYDVARQRIVLYGGQTRSAFMSDTWEYDGTDWTLVAQTGAPGIRRAHRLSYDVARQRTVLFGGDPSSRGNDTWEWDGSRWTRSNTTSAPSFRRYYGMSYDVMRGRTVLFGGDDYTVSLDDTWEFDGVDWTRRSPPRPVQRYYPHVVYDSTRGRCILFSGDSWRTSGPLTDTWAWDGDGWTEIVTRTPAPRLNLPGAAAEAPGGNIVFYDTYSADTWQFDGTDWKKLQPASSPGRVAEAEMVYDPVLRRTILFGGYRGGELNDTWAWDGNNWTLLQPATRPPGRGRQAMAYDVHRRRIVMFGGRLGSGAPLDDTWEFDGTTWIARNPSTRPGKRAFAKMAYDPVRRRTILGGYGSAADTWEWDGSNWTKAVGPEPVWKGDFDMMWDAGRQRITLFETSTMAVRHYGVPRPARATTIGQPCGGPGGLPRLVGGEPYTGNTSFALDLLSAQPNAPCVFALAGATQRLPLGGGCTLYLAGPMTSVVATTDALGFARLPTPIPPWPGLTGLEVHAQAAVAIRNTPLGLGFTAGREIVIGH